MAMVKRLTALALGVALNGAAAAMAQDTPIEAPGPEGALAGTMLEAGVDAPIVLILPGSGPTDRNGDSTTGVRPGSYKYLAEALRERGIASVRIDKRGMFGSKAALANPNAVTIGAYAQDVHSWIDAIRKRSGAPCVWVLGHSEGGLVALVASKTPAGICGLLLVSAAGRPLGTLIREQLNAGAVSPADAAKGDEILDSLEVGTPVPADRVPPGFAGLFGAAVQPFLIDALSHDPAKLAAAYRGPMLIVRGERDIQVSAADADALQAARPDATRIDVPGMTHVLKFTSSGERAANIATYLDPALPLAPGLADGIAGFVKSH